MHADRLLHLANVTLAKVKPEDFCMAFWWAHRGEFEFREVLEVFEDHPLAGNKCGTAGCAMGHACQDPYFRALGLSLNRGSPLFGNAARNTEAAAEVFDIAPVQADFLFDMRWRNEDRTNESPTDVANRIRAFVESGGEIPEP